MKHSDSMAAIGAALVKAQAEIKPVGKDAQNPHFRNRYATLDALTDFVRPILQKHGLVVIQGGVSTGQNGVEVETLLLHTSGEWISSSYVMPLEKGTSQGAGSAITYGRRYGLSSLLALTTDEDDDGHQASERSGVKSAAVTQTSPGVREASAGGSTPGPTLPATGEKFDAKCPKCGGKMWDNRIGKKNPKAPDAKCQNRSCDGVIWPPKPEDSKRPVATAAGMSENFEDFPGALEEAPDDLPF